MQSQAEQAKEMIKGIYDDGLAEINGREYKFTVMTHKKRRKVFAFYTKIAAKLQGNDFSFLDSDEFEAVESVINDSVTFNDSLLSRLGDAHWEKHPDDYLAFIGVALSVISYPFIQGRDTA
ncbi:MAG: hypothetical protein JKY80_01930 [Mariprofundaceae bacterium]|nr:hypothetical protein [Methylophaga sp.]MBL4759599.1 hypothetical protein [Mariprofundaceae bacterium]